MSTLVFANDILSVFDSLENLQRLLCSTEKNSANRQRRVLANRSHGKEVIEEVMESERNVSCH